MGKRWEIFITSHLRGRGCKGRFDLSTLVIAKRPKLFETARTSVRRTSTVGGVHSPTPLTDSATVWHNAGLIGSHVSAAMNSYVGGHVSRPASFRGARRSQKSDALHGPPPPPPPTLLQSDTLHLWFSDRKSFRDVAHFEKTRYTYIRDAESIFFTFVRW